VNAGVNVDVVVVGASAAGTFAALGARGVVADDGSEHPAAPDAPSVLLLDGQDRPGRKVLVSGGGRCNVTNTDVRPEDFRTGRPTDVRNVLRAFGSDALRRLLAGRGVPTVVEPLGKVFPEAPLRARDVLAAIDAAVADAGVQREHGTVVTDVVPDDGGWLVLRDGAPAVRARRVVVATGGRSVPATGSTGFGLELAARLGHDLAPPLPHLAALHGRLGGELAGLTVPATTRVVDADGRELDRATGSLLLTHRGASGPAALDVSGSVEQALADGRRVRVLVDLWGATASDGPLGPWLGADKLPGACVPDALPGSDPGEVDVALRAVADAHPRSHGAALLAGRLPRRLAEHLVADAGDVPLGQLSREARRDVARRVSGLDLRVTGTAGYASAEVTTGGVRLGELDRRTLASRRADGLHFCGEVCDATGRLGGFNFAWAWASGLVAGRGAAALVAPG